MSRDSRLRWRNHLTLYTLLIVLLSQSASGAELEEGSKSDFDGELGIVSEEIIRRYFRQYQCIVYVTDVVRDTAPIRSVGSTVIILNLNSTAETKVTRGLLVEVYEQDCRGFVLRLSVENRRATIPELIRSYKETLVSRYNNRRYLFLAADDTDDDSAFLDAPDMFYMPDLIFVAAIVNSTDFHALGHNYFDGHKYDRLGIKREIFDTWRAGSGFERNRNLYPDKFENVRGKLMTFAVMQYSPYTLVINEGGRFVYDGLETRIAAQYAELKNATWTGLDHPVHQWGDIFDNGTGNGAIGSVYEHRADFGFAAIYQWHCDVIECSYPYIYAGVTCLVPKPLLVSGWSTVILPFEPDVWIYIASAYFLASIFVFAISAIFHRIKSDEVTIPASLVGESFFSTFRVQIEQSPPESKDKSVLSVFFKIWTVYCFFVAVCWQGGIASILTIPRYEDAINDVHDLISRWPKMQWGGSHIDWIKSIEQTSEPELVKIVQDFMVLDEITLRKRVKTRDFGFFMERLPNGHYGMNDYIDEEAMKYLRIMEKNIYTANCVMILTKCSPYLESLDKMLLWMFDTGLIQKLEMQVSLEMINNRLQNMVKSSTENAGNQEVALLISHIQGAIFIYAFGMGVSSSVFVVEIYYLCRRKSKIKHEQKWISDLKKKKKAAVLARDGTTFRAESSNFSYKY